METPPALSVYCNQAYDHAGIPVAALDIVWQDACVVVWVKLEEIDLFPKVREADWDERGSARIGRCAGLPVFWCADGRGISLLVGPDDESWGVSMTMPLFALDQIIEALHEHRDWLATTPRFVAPERAASAA